jgi:predicted metal-binding membrane protein
VTADRAFRGTSALLFVTSAAATIYWCGSMSGGMPMPGGWTMSMAWMLMPGQSWPGAAAAFMGMWVLMMLPMMLPSLVPMLSSYRRSVNITEAAGLDGLTALLGAGYFFVWAVFGAAAYPVGVALGAAEMRWPGVARSVPLATGIVLVLAGCVQLSAWKARHLACCRDAAFCARSGTPDAAAAWRHGLHLGVHCCLCCSSFMMILLATGVMDPGVMAVVAAAITGERLAPRPQPVTRAAGVAVVAAGALLVARALGGA